MIDLYLLILNFFLLRVHPIRGPRATQGKEILSEIIRKFQIEIYLNQFRCVDNS